MKIDHCTISRCIGNKRQNWLQVVYQGYCWKVSVFVLYKRSRRGYRNVHILSSDGRDVFNVVFVRFLERTFKLNQSLGEGIYMESEINRNWCKLGLEQGAKRGMNEEWTSAMHAMTSSSWYETFELGCSIDTVLYTCRYKPVIKLTYFNRTSNVSSVCKTPWWTSERKPLRFKLWLFPLECSLSQPWCVN